MGRRATTGKRIGQQAVFNSFVGRALTAQKGVEFRTTNTRKKMGKMGVVMQKAEDSQKVQLSPVTGVDMLKAAREGDS